MYRNPRKRPVSAFPHILKFMQIMQWSIGYTVAMVKSKL